MDETPQVGRMSDALEHAPQLGNGDGGNGRSGSPGVHTALSVLEAVASTWGSGRSGSPLGPRSCRS